MAAPALRLSPSHAILCTAQEFCHVSSELSARVQVRHLHLSNLALPCSCSNNDPSDVNFPKKSCLPEDHFQPMFIWMELTNCALCAPVGKPSATVTKHSWKHGAALHTPGWQRIPIPNDSLSYVISHFFFLHSIFSHYFNYFVICFIIFSLLFLPFLSNLPSTTVSWCRPLM